jgi:lipoprotein-anchoring transpeptidase ErfK/SrfK
MPYFLRFHGGYGLHAGFLPGFPASHGCVRMPERMAQIFFANSSQGTPVRVVN